MQSQASFAVIFALDFSRRSAFHIQRRSNPFVFIPLSIHMHQQTTGSVFITRAEMISLFFAAARQQQYSFKRTERPSLFLNATRALSLCN